LLEAAVGLELWPTYAYARLYQPGDILIKHRDRPACEVSVSIHLGAADQTDWPIYVESQGTAIAVSLKPGDALVYRGCEVPHWREAFTGIHHAQVFFHYVERRGPYRQWKFDQRQALNRPPENNLAHLLWNPAPFLGASQRSD
jgi:alkylated DNA repair dioxygenase AlkB